MMYSRSLGYAVIGVVGALWSGCGTEDPAPRNALYVAAEAAFRDGCGSRSNVCHGQGGSTAMFDIEAAIASGDMRVAMVGVASCEYNLMDRVAPGDPDNSWVMVKMTAPFDNTSTDMRRGDLQFTPDSSWSEADKCNPAIVGFGKRMPFVSPFEPDPMVLGDIRAWIVAGAPGPNDPPTDAGTP